jgi:hypothetical protein
MKTGPDVLDNAENESERANMKMGPDAPIIVENEFGSAKEENMT